MREIKTIEQYRERMIEALHNGDYDELTAYVVLPFEEEFITLEKILKCWKRHSFYPSAEPKKGKWIPHEDEDGEHYGDKCSECGEWYVMPYGKTNFCPHCGARMDKE